jgi:ATP-dependent helicase HrpA
VRAEYLNYLRIREWQDLVAQLRQIVRPLGLGIEPRRDRRGGAAVGSSGTADPTTQRAGPLGESSQAAAGDGAPGREGIPSPRALASSAWEAAASVPRSPAPLAGGEPAPPPTAESTPWCLEWDAEAIHRALLPGLLSQLGMRLETEVGAKASSRGPGRGRRGTRNEYAGARGARFAIFPGSPVSARPPAWVMAAELVETSRLWARDVAGIDPAWAELAAGDLVRRTYSEPRWSARRGAGIVTEKVLLYGLPIVSARPAPLARYDRELARELFIRHALVNGEWRTHHRFLQANREFLDEAEQLVHRTRDRGWSIDPDDLFGFYDARIPGSVASTRDFDAWWKRARARTPDLLRLTPDGIGLRAEAPNLGHDFPDAWVSGAFQLPITYVFAPGDPEDGATVHIPIAIANQIPADGFDWQVPGLRADLIAALIKSLPKPQRIHLVPAPDAARAALARLGDVEKWRDEAGRIPALTEVLGRVFRELRDVVVAPEAWNYERVPGSLRLRFVVENARGEPMASGYDLAAVVHEADPAIRQAIAAVVRASGLDRAAPDAAGDSPDGAGPTAGRTLPAAARWPGERDRVETWDFGDLPREIGAGGVKGYPALVDEADHLAVRVLTDSARAAIEHARGVRGLVLGELRLPAGRITTRLADPVKLALASWSGGEVAVLVEDIQAAAVDSLIIEHGGVPWTQRGYVIVRAKLLDRLEDRVYRIAVAVAQVLEAAHRVALRLAEVVEPGVLDSAVEIRRHLDRLLAPGFVARAGEARLGALRRYVAADAYRLEHLGRTRAREQQGIGLVEQLEESYRTAVAGLPPGSVESPGLAEVPWMIEELRVSLFAQQLGTAYPISETRIRRALAGAAG